MCRIFRMEAQESNGVKRDSLYDHTSGDEIKENLIYSYTIEKIIKYINQEYKKLKRNYEEYLEKSLNFR